MATRTLQLFAIVLLLGVMSVSGYAQIIQGTPVSGGLSVHYSSWTVTYADESEETISQLAIPLSGLIPLKDNLEATYYIANASSYLETVDNDYSLNALSDLSIQLSQSLAQDHLLLSAGVNLPTGKKELDLDEEWLVLQILSADYLQMPIRQAGEGLGFNFIIGGATQLGPNARGGIGLSYEINGEYDPYEGVSDYDPGDVFNINGGVDFGTDSARLSFEAIYATFSSDQLDGDDVFKQSSQIDFRASGMKAGQSVTWSGLVRYLVRGDNEQLSTDTAVAELEAFQLYGNEFAAAGAALFRLGRNFHAGPSLQYRAIAESDVTGSSSVIGLGAAFSTALSEAVALDGGSTYLTGDADGGDLDLSGYTATLGLSAGF